MERAGDTHHEYASASNSLTLRGAVEEYHRRYGRPPPPGFDIWFRFAKDRNCKIINDYDQIIKDLEPFWAIEPKVLRERVNRVAAYEWNDIGLVSIRTHNTTVTVAPQWKVWSFEVGDSSGCRNKWSK